MCRGVPFSQTNSSERHDIAKKWFFVFCVPLVQARLGLRVVLECETSIGRCILLTETGITEQTVTETVLSHGWGTKAGALDEVEILDAGSVAEVKRRAIAAEACRGMPQALLRNSKSRKAFLTLPSLLWSIPYSQEGQVYHLLPLCLNSLIWLSPDLYPKKIPLQEI